MIFMNVIVTCGPAHEPIDTTRRITNLSTGRLGTLLAEAFQGRGWTVTLARAEGAVFRPAGAGVRTIPFGTNADLERVLGNLARTGNAHAVFHAAALCDFGVAEIRDGNGQPVAAGKLPSRADGYQLLLKPLPKLLPTLRALFPSAFLAGWKYETEGGRDAVVERGRRQLAEAGTDLCVLNGPGYGAGFGLLSRDGNRAEAADPGALAAALGAMLAGRAEP